MKKRKDNEAIQPITRREFLAKSAVAGAGLMIIPRHVLGGPGFVAPSDKLNIAAVGVMGKGESDIAAVATENIVALCDVDDTHMAKQIEKYPGARPYRDFRKMLTEMDKSIDAVTISTPDHTHAVIAMMAMGMGKHVFCQKPLTHTIKEARTLAATARKAGIVSQMGNQGHAGEGGRLICEWIWDGAIGEVREVHCWTNRPIWPQGMVRPTTTEHTPSSFDWNLWLGPAKFRGYNPAYSHFVWRGWRDFGTGALGDMGAHIFDHPFWALNLGYPTSIYASSSPFTDDSYALATKVHYEFPARENMPPVKLTWYDGGLFPERPEIIEEGRRMGDGGGGVLYVGSKGMLMHGTYGSNPRLIPETAMKAYTRPEKTIPRSPGIHEEWVAACKGEGKTTSNFDYASRLTEVMLLGNVAVWMKDKQTRLHYDGENMKFTNLPEADQFLDKEYHGGFTL